MSGRNAKTSFCIVDAQSVKNTDSQQDTDLHDGACVNPSDGCN